MAARRDKARWLEELIAIGDWNALQIFRKGRRKQEGRLKDSTGNLVGSECRAETLAEHLDKIQWKVRPATLVPDTLPAIREELRININPFTLEELKTAISKFRPNKATKPGDVPIEIFNAPEGLQWVLDFCNKCLVLKVVPQDWSTASIAMVFKKRDPAECNNYRPISILNIVYKIFAAILKNRLVEARV